MASPFASTTGLYAEAPALTDEQIAKATAVVLKHVRADEADLILMMLGIIPSPDPVRLCSRGSHRMTPENTTWQGPTKVCKACKKDREKKKR